MWVRFKVYPTTRETADKLGLQGESKAFNISPEELTAEKVKEVQETLLAEWVRTKGKGIEMKLAGKNPYDLPDVQKVRALRRTLWSDSWREKIARQLRLELPAVNEVKRTARRIYELAVRVSSKGIHYVRYTARDRKSGRFVKAKGIRRFFR